MKNITEIRRELTKINEKPLAERAQEYRRIILILEDKKEKLQRKVTSNSSSVQDHIQLNAVFDLLAKAFSGLAKTHEELGQCNPVKQYKFF